jgi:hypothetical protein
LYRLITDSIHDETAGSLNVHQKGTKNMPHNIVETAREAGTFQTLLTQPKGT